MKYLYRGICSVILTAIAGASFFYVWYSFVQTHNNTGYLIGRGNLAMSLTIYLALYYIVGQGIRAFKIGVERTSNIVASQVMTVLVVDISEVFISMAISGQWRYIGALFGRYLILWVVQSIVLGMLSVVMISIYRGLFPPIDVIEIYGRENGLGDKVNGLSFKYRVTETIYVKDHGMDEIMELISRHEAVLLNDLSAKRRNRILKACFDMDKRAYVIPKISDVIIKGSEPLNLFDTPVFLCRNREMTRWQRSIKRMFDIVISLMGLILLSPLLIFTALAIHMEDGGPVYYRQERVTRGGRRFYILKFRSMIVDAEADGKPHPAGDDDDRITRVGRFIRAWRIDELPQLTNILRGEMSIVGPRPERVEYVEKYTAEIPEFSFRLKVKGGLTGYAQVYGKYNTSALDKLKLDLTYITNYSLLTDIQIIFETVKILFLKESTEGFKNEEE